MKHNRIIIEFGHTLEEYQRKYGYQYGQGALWDIPIEEAFDGTFDEESLNGVYWLIDGRFYETGYEEE